MPGLCFIYCWPGAAYANLAINTALEDSTPLILFVDQAKSGMRERVAFQ